MPAVTRRMAKAQAADEAPQPPNEVLQPDTAQQQQDPASEQSEGQKSARTREPSVGQSKSVRPTAKTKARTKSAKKVSKKSTVSSSSRPAKQPKGLETITTQDVPINRLPLDLLSMVFDFLEERDSLEACTLVCRFWTAEAQRLLYRRLSSIRRSFGTTFSKAPQYLIQHTQQIQLKDQALDLSQVLDVLKCFTGLQTLHFRSCIWKSTKEQRSVIRTTYSSPVYKLKMLDMYQDCIDPTDLILIIRLLQAEMIHLTQLRIGFYGSDTEEQQGYEDDVSCRLLDVWPDHFPDVIDVIQKARLNCKYLRYNMSVNPRGVTALRPLLARLGQSPEFTVLHLILANYEGAEDGSSGLDLATLPALESLKLEIHDPRNTGNLLKPMLDEVLHAPGRKAPVLKVQLGLPGYHLKHVGTWDPILSSYDRSRLQAFKIKVVSGATFRVASPRERDVDFADVDWPFERSYLTYRPLTEADKELVLKAMPKLQAIGLLEWD